MNQPLRIGLIGAGMVSRHHLIAWASIPDQARVVAIADPSPENAARRASEFGIEQSHASAEAMLACSGALPGELTYDLAVEYQGSYNRTIAHFVNALRDNTPFETAPPDNLQTLRLVEDCYRLSGWEALR
ncbi:Gfo/Idh/MocA family oxidoreductase [Bradyrhizobium sp.]|uniref:Gfo/Idh/MocA family oxidoreductase n=1 Tax=Bradyrhizobium sp. TaxID=376 RepID=UPI002C01895D|nr:Gfo/Idh/MocA family oxidoreductase [Bradyrhizobium sp.]HMM89842.1 Gfo/Idh/MocA family oxidoreductase [Bradyrhizobium sp.]